MRIKGVKPLQVIPTGILPLLAEVFASQCITIFCAIKICLQTALHYQFEVNTAKKIGTTIFTRLLVYECFAFGVEMFYLLKKVQVFLKKGLYLCLNKNVKTFQKNVFLLASEVLPSIFVNLKGVTPLNIEHKTMLFNNLCLSNETILPSFSMHYIYSRNF